MPPIFNTATLKVGAAAVAAAFVGSTSVFGGALPAPTTVNFTAAQVSPGLSGMVSTTKNAARIYGSASKTSWTGYISGTEAKLTATSEWGSGAGLIEVSVDGSAFSAAPNVGSLYTLFTGLPHAQHLVVWRFNSAYAEVPYINSSGNVLSVTGQPPAISPFQYWSQPFDGSAFTIYSSKLENVSAGYLPTKAAAPSSVSAGSNVSCIKVRGAFTKLAITANSTAVYVSVNGAAATRYPIGAGGVMGSVVVSGLSGVAADYFVWNTSDNVIQCFLGVSGDAANVDCGVKRRLDQYGDSITNGIAGGGDRGSVDTMRCAAALGFVGSTSGIDGHTIQNCDTLLDSVLPGRTVTASDVAVVAIGRNNVGGAFDGAETTAFQSIITKLLAKGYGKVLCRGILPAGDRSTIWTAENASMQSIVSALANANVIYVEANAMPVYGTLDLVHPNPAGYLTIADHFTPLYASALGL